MPERWVNVKQNSESTWPRIYDFSEAYNPPTCSKKVVTNRKSLIKLFDTCPVLPTSPTIALATVGFGRLRQSFSAGARAQPVKKVRTSHPQLDKDGCQTKSKARKMQ
jgi:hypothetical protein